MKKTFLLFFLCSLLFSLSEVHAYTSTDVSNAKFLSGQGIIVTQSTAAGYRLDDTITRAEAVGIALKIQGVVLPSYQCKGYFSDVTNDDWICRAVEIAADQELITRANAKFRPNDTITRAEALAIVMKTGGVEDISSAEKQSYLDQGLNFFYASGWQEEIILKAYHRGIITITPERGNSSTGTKPYGFFYNANTSATRAEVFGFARNISGNAGDNNIFVSTPKNHIQQSYSFFWKESFDHEYGEFYSANKGDFTFNIRTCGLRQSPENLTEYFSSGKKNEVPIEIAKTANGITVFYYILEGPTMQPGVIFKSDGGSYRVYNYGVNISDCTSQLKPSLFNNIDANNLLKIYYHNLGVSFGYSFRMQNTYDMRFPAGVSFETFQSWYKNTTNVIFREDTLKNLGDNTYEFLVDMTENSVKSTYKVKSKVDLENFKINNISSVKQ